MLVKTPRNIIGLLVARMIRNLYEMGPTLQKIMKRLQANQNLMKLLYYTDPDPLSQEDFTPAEVRDKIYEKLIKIVPRVGPHETATSVVSIRVESALRNRANTEFNNITLKIEVFVPLTQWFIKDENLRPFAIMAEILNSLNGKVIDGIGRMEGGDFLLNFLTDEIAAFEMTFSFVQYD